MELLDEEGNLFGVVNVVDALVVLLVLAVVVAGLAVVGVFGGGEGESATRYATVDLGAQPEYVAAEISAGDRMVVGDGRNVTITDVYRSGASGGTNPEETHVVVRTSVDGTLRDAENRDDRVFHFAGQPLQVGRQLTVDTADYSMEGQVTSVENERRTLRTNRTQALVEAIVSERTADSIETGDEYRVAGETVATVETVRSYPVEDERRRVQLGLSLSTIQERGRSTFAGQTVTVDSTVGVYTDSYGFNGTVIRRGALEPPGSDTTTSVVLEMKNVAPNRVGGITAGTTETQRGRTLATVRSIDTEPAEVILESEDGNIYAREHPTNVTATIEADLATRATDTGLRFHGEPLRPGRTVTLDFGTARIDAAVASIESD